MRRAIGKVAIKPVAIVVATSLIAVVAVVAATLLFTSANAPADGLPGFNDAIPNEELSAKILEEMTDEELLAQVLMFGWAGEEPSQEVKDWVGTRALGSIKIFGWNTDNTEKVAESILLLQKEAAAGRFQIPLFVATDQEGGWIRHIKGRTSETPGNLAIGASALPSDAWYTGYYIAKELRAVGINLNFAPTVDLYTDHDSTVIGPRSFGEDPQSAGMLGASFAAGSRAAGVLSTAKHFPGHGDTGGDSHGVLPVIYADKKTLRERELIPFQMLIDSGVSAIMSAYLSFPLIEKSGAPATFSEYFLTDLLRGELGFKGLIVTDDIMMNGATEYAGSVSRAVQLALLAGNDIIESSTTPSFRDALWVKTLELMKSSPDFRARVADAANRVILAKLDYFKGDNPVPVFPDPKRIDESVPDPEAHTFFLSQATRSVTLVRAGTFPLDESKRGKTLIAGAYPAFLEAGKRRFPDADTAPIGGKLWSTARAYDTVIYCLSSKDSLSILKDLQWLDANVVVVSSLAPVLLNEVPRVKTAVAVYSYAPVSFEAAFASLAGDFVPEGVMPLGGVK